MERGLTCAILVGGLGTRLRSVLPDAPKPMAPVSGRPFLEYLLAQISSSGCTDIVLCVGYKAEAIANYFGDGSKYGLEIRYSQEQELLGTAGALSIARSKIRSDPFLVMNGDSYCAIDFAALVNQHQLRGAKATIATTWVDDQSRYGNLVLGSEDSIVGFREKGEASGSGYINAGIYLLNQSVLDLIPNGKCYSIERDIFPALAGKGLYAFKTSGMFIDMGIPSELERSQAVFIDYPGLA
jgi:D-glycero-alpha-D-manno-heptose 1-phosphate guanylyltransferase